MIKVAILGYGTIGSGVVEVLERNKDHITQTAGEEIEVKYVLDLRDFPGDEIQEKIVYTIDEIAYVIQAVYQSKIEFIKFNLDVELDTVDLLIKQKGYYKDTI